MYGAVLLEHFRAPRNAGPMRDADAVGESQEGRCGDVARFYLRVRDGRIQEARFQAYGCGPAIAASSLATELLTGQPVAALDAVTAESLERALGGLPTERLHAAEVVVAALRAAAARYRARPGTEGASRA